MIVPAGRPFGISVFFAEADVNKELEKLGLK
jgi:hypothetical protein